MSCGTRNLIRMVYHASFNDGRCHGCGTHSDVTDDYCGECASDGTADATEVAKEVHVRGQTGQRGVSWDEYMAQREAAPPVVTGGRKPRLK